MSNRPHIKRVLRNFDYEPGTYEYQTAEEICLNIAQWKETQIIERASNWLDEQGFDADFIIKFRKTIHK